MRADLQAGEVKRVALAMDADSPGWADKIDQNILFRNSSGQDSTDNCILVQVYGAYTPDKEKILCGQLVPVQDSPFWPDFCEDEGEGDYDALRALWAVEINARQGDGA